jgi:hypothetical protein
MGVPVTEFGDPLQWAGMGAKKLGCLLYLCSQTANAERVQGSGKAWTWTIPFYLTQPSPNMVDQRLLCNQQPCLCV